MDIFHYRHDTGEYIGPGIADENPLDPENPIIPAFATYLAPPEGADKKVRVFESGAWKLKPDHRGESWWRVQAKYNNEPQVVVDFIGDPLFRGLTKEEPPAPPPPPPLPGVTPRQIRKALSQMGLRQAIEDYVDGASLEVQDAWQYALSFERDDPLLNQAAAALGKTEQEVDGLFELARSL